MRAFSKRIGMVYLAVGIALAAIGTALHLAPLGRADRVRPRGDGRDPASYGFDLAQLLVPKDRIVSSGLVVDGLPALVEPATIAAEEVGRRYLVGDDKIVGVVIENEARAYPLRVLAWHEVVNDRVGGIPIAVTYNPLSHGIAVFDRRVEGGTLTFGVSGLLYQSNLLMYDRRTDAKQESLWSQLQARAISGPAAGKTLSVLPLALARWDAWLAAWPATRVLAPIAVEMEKYNRDAYATYVSSDALRFPVDPLPPKDGPIARKTPVFAAMSVTPPFIVPLEIPPGERRFEVVGPSGTTPAPGIYAFWFAWYATHPPA